MLVIGAAVIEFWPTDELPYPFAAGPIQPGEPLTVEWRMLPAGAYPRPTLTGEVAAHALAEGEPITESDLQRPVTVPEGWWALALEVPARLAPGTAIRLVLSGDDTAVPGVVVSSDDPDRFSVSGPTALVAVPAEDAWRVAAAVAGGGIVVLVAP